MIFPGTFLCDRVLPDYLGRAVQQRFVEKGVRIPASGKPVSFSKNGGKFITRAMSGFMPNDRLHNISYTLE